MFAEKRVWLLFGLILHTVDFSWACVATTTTTTTTPAPCTLAVRGVPFDGTFTVSNVDTADRLREQTLSIASGATVNLNTIACGPNFLLSNDQGVDRSILDSTLTNPGMPISVTCTNGNLAGSAGNLPATEDNGITAVRCSEPCMLTLPNADNGNVAGQLFGPVDGVPPAVCVNNIPTGEDRCTIEAAGGTATVIDVDTGCTGGTFGIWLGATCLGFATAATNTNPIVADGGTNIPLVCLADGRIQATYTITNPNTQTGVTRLTCGNCPAT